MIPNNQKNDEITAIILAGGKSSRMGFDKSLIKYNDKSIIQIIFDVLDSVFTNIIVISNSVANYKFLNTLIYSDYYVGKGPLAGIHSGLTNSLTKKNFIISCDLPFIDSKLIDYLISQKSNKQIVIPTLNNKIQPLCGLYSQEILPKLSTYLKENINKTNKKLLSVKGFLETVDYEKVDAGNLQLDSSKILFNLNDKNDLEFLKQSSKN